MFNRSTVRAFAGAHADARQPLFAWFAELLRARWTGPTDIRASYPSASFLAGNRVVFNIKGNKSRVVVAIKDEFFAVYIRFIGTHAEYDAIDAATIQGPPMNIQPIRTAGDHAAALKELERIWDRARPGTPGGDKFEVLSALVDAYEREHIKIAAPDPIEAIRFRMDQEGLTTKDLLPIFRTRARASEVMAKKRRINLAMIRRLHSRLAIPVECLVQDYKLKGAGRTARPRRRQAARAGRLST